MLGKVLHSIASTASATLPAPAASLASPAAPPANVPAPSLPTIFPTITAVAPGSTAAATTTTTAAVATTPLTTTTIAAAPSAQDDAGGSRLRFKRPVSCAGRRPCLSQYLPGLHMRHLLWEAHLRTPRRPRLHLLRVLQRHPRRATTT